MSSVPLEEEATLQIPNTTPLIALGNAGVLGAETARGHACHADWRLSRGLPVGASFGRWIRPSHVPRTWPDSSASVESSRRSPRQWFEPTRCIGGVRVRTWLSMWGVSRVRWSLAPFRRIHDGPIIDLDSRLEIVFHRGQRADQLFTVRAILKCLGDDPVVLSGLEESDINALKGLAEQLQV